MEFKLKKGLFNTNTESTKELELVPSNNQPNNGNLTYKQWGFQKAGELGGTIAGLHASLHIVYLDIKKKIIEDENKQNELKQSHRIRIEHLKGENDKLNGIIQNENEKLNHEESKIEHLKEELANVKKHPETVTADPAIKASLIIGIVILLFLTIYLLIFYSSATYSAFFKDFTLNNIGVASSIFDPNAIGKATTDGFAELALILTIPFVFLGLGYLINKFQEQKGFGKIIKVGSLILITFLFDTILAYGITEKIYNITKENSFDEIPAYSLKMAAFDVHFWTIIFAGFIVYIIWGFVFDFVMDSYAKIDKVKVEIDQLKLKIADSKIECKNFKQNIQIHNGNLLSNTAEIEKEKRIIDGVIVPITDVKLEIMNFQTGWLNFLHNIGYTNPTPTEVQEAVTSFVRNADSENRNN
jgi:hypothetical protein